MPSEGHGPRRLHPLSPLFDLVGVARQAALPVILAASRGGGGRLLVTVLVVLLALRVLAWSRRTYLIEKEVFRVDEGVLGRRHRALPLDRIQQVDAVRKVRHRLLGVVTLRIETAGSSGGSEINLEVVSTEEAERLRGALLGRAPQPAGGGPAERDRETTPAPSETVIVRLGPGMLALAGMTGAKLGVVLTIAASLTQVADDLGVRMDVLDPPEMLPSGVAVLFAFGLLLPLWLGLAAGASILVDGGFTLSRRGDDFAVRRGLLDRRELAVPAARVQVLRVEQSPLRRVLGVVSLRVQSAGSLDGDSAALVVPLIGASDLDRVVSAVLPGAAPWPPLVPAPAAARRRAVVRAVAPAALAAGAVTALAWPTGAVALAAVPLAAILGVASYRALGHVVAGGFLVSRRGAVIRRTWVVPSVKAQSARVRSSPLQRRAGLATLAVDVAARGRVPEVVDQSEGTASALLGLVLPAVDRPVAGTWPAET